MRTTEQIKQYKHILDASENFVQEIFDWVRPLGQAQMLNHMFDFRYAVKQKIKELERQRRDEVNHDCEQNKSTE